MKSKNILNGRDKILHLHHWYQPPWQFPKVLAKIVEECYRPMSEFYAEVENFKVAVNINYSLTQQLVKFGFDDVIDNLKIAAKKGNVEFVGSSANHAFGPYTPKDEFLRQIELNEKGNKKVFGSVWMPKSKRGFFPPEMGFNPELAKTIKEAGFAWSVAAGITLFEEEFPSNKIPTINSLPMFFRADDWSRAFAMDWANDKKFNAHEFVSSLGDSLFGWFLDRRNQLKEEYEKNGKKLDKMPDNYLVLGFDVETMGHHHKGYDKKYMLEYAKALYEKGFESVSFSEYLKSNPNKYELIKNSKDEKRFHSSWSTEKHHMQRGEPFPLWTPANPINKLQHELIDLATKAVKEAQVQKCKANLSREILDYSRNSCKLWWANEGYLWNPTYLLVGAGETMQVFYALEKETRNCNFDSLKYLKKAEKIFEEIKNKIKERDPNAFLEEFESLPDYFLRKDIIRL